MAITIISQIDEDKFLPSANPINITVDSNNNGKCNFRYVCDVYINDINVFRFKLFPDPNTGYGFFQLSNVINDYLKEYMPDEYDAGITIASDTGSNPNKSLVSVKCEFGEEYDSSQDCDGEIEIYPNLNTSNTFYVFYGAIDYEDWPNFNTTGWSNYVTDHSYSINTPIKFLTNRPDNSVDCSYDDNYFLDYLMDATSSDDVKLAIRLNGDDSQKLTIPISNFIKKQRLRIACGPLNINKYYENSIINADVKYYEVWVEVAPTSIPIRVTERFRINVKKPKTYKTRLGFIGLLGSPEYITFYHRNRKRYDIDRKNFKNYLTSKIGNQWTYSVGDRESQTYATNAQERHNVTTFVNSKETEWLYEMWLSTNVWVEDKPDSYPFEIFRESSSPTSRMLLRLPEGHSVEVGDNVFIIPDNQPNFSIYTGRFQVQQVIGRNIHLGFTFNNYNTTACGWLVVDKATRRIPIIADDETIEVQQKAGSLIEYSLQYTTSVDKITLRG
jgi:hypothetical protein